MEMTAGVNHHVGKACIAEKWRKLVMMMQYHLKHRTRWKWKREEQDSRTCEIYEEPGKWSK